MKTFMIAFLCIWTSSAFAMAQDKSIINRSEVKTVQQRQHRELPPRHHSAMNEKDFQFLYKIIKKKSFDDDKLKIIRIMANHIVDLENHYDILMRLDFDSNKRKALDILNVHEFYN